MYKLRHATKFKKDYKKIRKDPSFSLSEFKFVIQVLVSGRELDKKYRDHKLHGDYRGCRECHIKPDLLMIYEIDHENLILCTLRIGSHPELFRQN